MENFLCYGDPGNRTANPARIPWLPGLVLLVSLFTATAVGIACGGSAPGVADVPTPGISPTSGEPADAQAKTPALSPSPAATQAPSPAATRTAPTTAEPPRTATQPGPPTNPPTNTPEPTEQAPRQVLLEIAPESVARYRVREQFARRDFPNDAVGETSEVAGAIALASDGSVLPDRSEITVKLRTLMSDDSDRDDFLETDSLESIKFPLAEYVIEEAPGLPWPLPDSGEARFQLSGSMNIHGVTSPLTWEVTARFGPDGVTGLAQTSFPFEKFGMERPSVFFLLSVDNEIRLELDFVATFGSGGSP